MGRPSLLKERWEYLLLMQQKIETGQERSAVATSVARKYYRELTGLKGRKDRPVNLDSVIRWLKDHEVKYRTQLQDHLKRERRLQRLKLLLASPLHLKKPGRKERERRLQARYGPLPKQVKRDPRLLTMDKRDALFEGLLVERLRE